MVSGKSDIPDHAKSNGLEHWISKELRPGEGSRCKVEIDVTLTLIGFELLGDGWVIHFCISIFASSFLTT